MKHWLIQFSIKYINGKKKEGQATIEASDITTALGLAIINIQKPYLLDPEISDFVIWDVGIVEDEVFPEEK